MNEYQANLLIICVTEKIERLKKNLEKNIYADSHIIDPIIQSINEYQQILKDLK